MARSSAQPASFRSTQLAYPLTAGLLYGAALLRTLLLFDGTPLRNRALLLLLGWLALSAVAVMIDRSRPHPWPGWFPLYLAVQSVLVVLLISMSDRSDFYAVLFSIPAAR